MLTANATKHTIDSQGVRLVFEQELALHHGSRAALAYSSHAREERPSQIMRRADTAPDSSPRALAPSAPLAGFWRAFTSGGLSVVETFANRQRCCVIAEERGPTSKSYALTERELILLKRTFQGETQKVLASGFDLSVAAISQMIGAALRKLGLSCRVGCTPLPVVLVALETCGSVRLPEPYLKPLEHDGHRYVALGLPAFDPDVLPDLSYSERQVAVAHAFGGTYAEIAQRRATSPRTVANQIASLSKKLDVRGRFELIQLWARLQWGGDVSAG